MHHRLLSLCLPATHIRIDHNQYIYTVYARYFWQGDHHIYSHVRSIFMYASSQPKNCYMREHKETTSHTVMKETTSHTVMKEITSHTVMKETT